MTIKEIEQKIEEQENTLQELKKELEKTKENENKIPDGVKDIPQTYDFDDYERMSEYFYEAWIMNCKCELVRTIMDEESIKEGNMAFPTIKFAEMFRKKAQFIADCLLFKWHYDRNYVPDFSLSNNYETMYAVAYDPEAKLYQWCTESYIDYNQIYFSSEEIAEKCAEWLNYKYFGVYNLKESESECDTVR